MKVFERKLDSATRKTYMVEVEVNANDLPDFDSPFYTEVACPVEVDPEDYADAMSEKTGEFFIARAGKVYRQLNRSRAI